MINGQWYEFDDQYVTEVHETVVQSAEAYVLFYRWAPGQRGGSGALAACPQGVTGNRVVVELRGVRVKFLRRAPAAGVGAGDGVWVFCAVPGGDGGRTLEGVAGLRTDG